MGTKSFLTAVVLALVSATVYAQGLTGPFRMHSPRLADPMRLSPSEGNGNIRALNQRNDNNRRSASLLNIFPGRRFNFPPQIIPGSGGGVGVGGGTVIIGAGDHDHVFDPVSGSFDYLHDPDMARTLGQNSYAVQTGQGNRAAGIGTGVGNKFAGLGAYYYGQGAGLGMMFSGMGDFAAGQGRYLEGQGAYEQMNSVANINNEEAEYRDMKNNEYNASAFFNKRRTNIEGRRYEEDAKRYAIQRLSTEQLAKLQDQRAPERLNFQQYDETTGALAWPALLKNPYFAESREQINRLFANRTKLGASTGLGSDNYREIRQITQQIERDLRDAMLDMTPMEYTMAKNFLRSLEFEAQHPMATAFPVARVADAR